MIRRVDLEHSSQSIISSFKNIIGSSQLVAKRTFIDVAMMMLSMHMSFPMIVTEMDFSPHAFQTRSFHTKQ